MFVYCLYQTYILINWSDERKIHNFLHRYNFTLRNHYFNILSIKWLICLIFRSCNGDRSFGITYKILRRGSKKHRPLLQSSEGHTYNTRKIKSMTIWWCTVDTCLASVLQKGKASFTAGYAKHSHPPGADSSTNSQVLVFEFNFQNLESILM